MFSNVFGVLLYLGFRIQARHVFRECRFLQFIFCLKVEGSADDEKFVIAEDGQRFAIDALDKLGHAMSEDNAALSTLGQDSLLTVFYPKSSSRLLQNDVIFVDRLVFFLILVLRSHRSCRV